MLCVFILLIYFLYSYIAYLIIYVYLDVSFLKTLYSHFRIWKIPKSSSHSPQKAVLAGPLGSYSLFLTSDDRYQSPVYLLELIDLGFIRDRCKMDSMICSHETHLRKVE